MELHGYELLDIVEHYRQQTRTAQGDVPLSLRYPSDRLGAGVVGQRYNMWIIIHHRKLLSGEDMLHHFVAEILAERFVNKFLAKTTNRIVFESDEQSVIIPAGEVFLCEKRNLGMLNS